jgi:hypothetical protein
MDSLIEAGCCEEVPAGITTAASVQVGSLRMLRIVPLPCRENSVVKPQVTRARLVPQILRVFSSLRKSHRRAAQRAWRLS